MTLSASPRIAAGATKSASDPSAPRPNCSLLFSPKQLMSLLLSRKKHTVRASVSALANMRTPREMFRAAPSVSVPFLSRSEPQHVSVRRNPHTAHACPAPPPTTIASRIHVGRSRAVMCSDGQHSTGRGTRCGTAQKWSAPFAMATKGPRGYGLSSAEVHPSISPNGSREQVSACTAWIAASVAQARYRCPIQKSTAVAFK